jgi:GNAT superfamily N-acetyltransferase
LRKSERNTIRDEFGIFKAVNDFTVFGGFSCNDTDLDDFIHQDAMEQQAELLGIIYAFMLIDDPHERPLVFASLSNSAIKLKPGHPARKAINKNVSYKDFPAVKIGRFGVRKEVQGKGLGGHTMNLIKQFFTTDNRTGCRFLVVDAYNKPDILRFYMKNHFAFYDEKDATRKTRIMYYDLLRPMPEPD